MTPAENEAIELHDSVLERIDAMEAECIVVLRAYLHRSSGVPGVDAGTGWIQACHLHFRDGRTSGNVAEFPMEILDGSLETSSERIHNHLPLPIDHAGPATLEVMGWNDSRVVVVGNAVKCVLVGSPHYLEDVPGPEKSS